MDNEFANIVHAMKTHLMGLLSSAGKVMKIAIFTAIDKRRQRLTEICISYLLVHSTKVSILYYGMKSMSISFMKIPHMYNIYSLFKFQYTLMNHNVTLNH